MNIYWTFAENVGNFDMAKELEVNISFTLAPVCHDLEHNVKA